MEPADTSAVLELLTKGQLEVEGRLVAASNATFYCSLDLNGVTAAAVYKPVRGERPLWDFPHGSLARREVATYLLSVASGWNLVPPTVLREGPLGDGMCQLWIDHNPDADVVDVVRRSDVPVGWRSVLQAYDTEGDEVTLVHADDDALRRMAVFDTLVNNADRKAGHVLVAEDGRVFGVDHGLCFHEDPKLRTVLWGWAGEPIPDECAEVLARLECDLDGAVGAAMAKLLHRDEVRALRQRMRRLQRVPVFPEPDDGWPSIPWPVF